MKILNVETEEALCGILLKNVDDVMTVLFHLTKGGSEGFFHNDEEWQKDTLKFMKYLASALPLEKVKEHLKMQCEWRERDLAKQAEKPSKYESLLEFMMDVRKQLEAQSKFKYSFYPQDDYTYPLSGKRIIVSQIQEGEYSYFFEFNGWNDERLTKLFAAMGERPQAIHSAYINLNCKSYKRQFSFNMDVISRVLSQATGKSWPSGEEIAKGLCGEYCPNAKFNLGSTDKYELEIRAWRVGGPDKYPLHRRKAQIRPWQQKGAIITGPCVMKGLGDMSYWLPQLTMTIRPIDPRTELSEIMAGGTTGIIANAEEKEVFRCLVKTLKEGFENQ